MPEECQGSENCFGGTEFVSVGRFSHRDECNLDLPLNLHFCVNLKRMFLHLMCRWLSCLLFLVQGMMANSHLSSYLVISSAAVYCVMNECLPLASTASNNFCKAQKYL